MNNIFFISDTHLGHKNIIPYNRPWYLNLDDMHRDMLLRWNSIVKPKDIVYHLGDVAFGKINIQLISKFNGIKKLILGNHDRYPLNEYKHFFSKIVSYYPFHDGILSHVPIHESQLEYRFKYNIHGHMHNASLPDKRYINVCADQINLTPLHWDEIKEKWIM